MALINIEYGSLASSDIMNKNFLYLDDKIADCNNSTSTNISSILSNLATINSRLSDLAENVAEYVDEFNKKLDEYKTKTKALVLASSLLPNWQGVTPIDDMTDFVVTQNGHLLLKPLLASSGTIEINGVSHQLKSWGTATDNGAQMLLIPVKNGDVVKSTMKFHYSMFLPVYEVKIEDF